MPSLSPRNIIRAEIVVSGVWHNLGDELHEVCITLHGLLGVSCCNVAIGWEGYLANGGPQGPIYGQDRQRTASNRLLESHRKQSSNGLQQVFNDGTMEVDGVRGSNIDCRERPKR